MADTFDHLLAIIVEVDAHIDAQTARAYRDQPLAGHWARITKVCEEAGEVWRALSKATGENPRKGVCGTWDELLEELGDAMSAAACGIQHITKDEARTREVIVAAFEKAYRRIPEYGTNGVSGDRPHEEWGGCEGGRCWCDAQHTAAEVADLNGAHHG